MSQQELLARVVAALDAQEVPYMATGSIVSSLQGEPRATHDVDLVVAMPPQSVGPIVRTFAPPEYYLDEQAVRNALARRDMFNLLQVTTGDKVDFWVLTDEPYDRSRFARRRSVDALNMRLFVSAPEDTILQKLKWAELSGGSEKHFTDALRVYELQRPNLDLAYINTWAQRLGVDAEWRRIQDEAEPV
jgi:hypothetical protein